MIAQLKDGKGYYFCTILKHLFKVPSHMRKCARHYINLLRQSPWHQKYKTKKINLLNGHRQQISNFGLFFTYLIYLWCFNFSYDSGGVVSKIYKQRSLKIILLSNPMWSNRVRRKWTALSILLPFPKKFLLFWY
jgi:hypothetical protein